jgi:hypothetical protein
MLQSPSSRRWFTRDGHEIEPGMQVLTAGDLRLAQVATRIEAQSENDGWFPVTFPDGRVEHVDCQKLFFAGQVITGTNCVIPTYKSN